MDNYPGPCAAPTLDHVGQDQGDRHKGQQDLPGKGSVEQQPQDPVDQPSPPPEGNLLPRQCDTPPDKLFPNGVQHKKRESRAKNPVPAGTKRLESHKRRMEILLDLQHSERGADAASQHADGSQPSDSPEPVAAIHRAKPQPRAQRTQPSWTPFSIQQQGSREE